MLRYGNGSVPIATGWKCTNCHRTHRSSIPRSGSGNTRARPELTTGTSRPPRNWPVPCPESLERCKTILSRSDPICFLFADRNVPLIMRGCIADLEGFGEKLRRIFRRAVEGWIGALGTRAVSSKLISSSLHYRRVFHFGVATGILGRSQRRGVFP